jgi:hypothetical protein
MKRARERLRLKLLRSWGWLLKPLLPGVLSCWLGTGSLMANDPCAVIPKGAIPPPCGTYVNRFIAVQAGKAEADDFVVYKHEWLNNGIRLGPYGGYHLAQIVKRLNEVPFPVLIQVDADPQLNETRRAFYVAQLTVMGVPDAQRRVILGYPEAEGLYGEEAPRIYRSMIYERIIGGGFGGGYGGGFSGFGSGFGGFGGLGGFGGVGGFGGGFGGFGGGFGGF